MVGSMKQIKLVVFVPLTHAERVRKAMGDAGAGVIGNYTHCSFSSIGTGRFTPNDQANPFVGKRNQNEKVNEERIEMICPQSKAKKVIQAMKKVHPYEEVAFDIYPLLNEKDL